MSVQKVLSYFLVLGVGIIIGWAVSAWSGQMNDHSYASISLEVQKAIPETMGKEVVNDEIMDILMRMYDANESVQIHMQRDNLTYPAKTIEGDTFVQMLQVFDEYEWHPNRSLSSFEASDFDVLIKIYSPDGAQVLTLYRGYDLVLYKDAVNEVAAYYTYVLPDNDFFGGLVERLKGFIEK